MIDQDGKYVDTSGYQYGGDGQYATVDTSSTGANDGNAGESAPSWWSGFDFGDSAVTQAVNMALGGGDSAAETARLARGQNAAAVDQAQPEEGMLAKFQRLGSGAFEGLQTGAKKAWKDSPLELLKLGAGAVGNAYLSEEKRKAAQALAQSSIDQQNNKAAIEQAKVDAYNASFRTGKKRAPVKQTPLTRIDGTPVYTNGKLNRG